MTIAHDAEAHTFVAYAEDGGRMGEIEYSPRGDGIIAATHTLVDKAHRGKGVAGALLRALTEWAEAEGGTIVPVCSFVMDAFEREPERYRKVMQKQG